jgi:TonB family protein
MKYLLINFMVLLVGCTSMQTVSDQTVIGSKKAKGSALILAKPYKFEKALGTDTLPAGRYVPIIEDADGVYYQSPTPIRLKGLLAESDWEGGIYLKKTSPPQAYEYLMGRDNYLARYRLHDDFRFTLEDKKPSDHGSLSYSAMRMLELGPSGATIGYDRRLFEEINDEWQDLVENSIHAEGDVTVQFKLMANGSVQDLRVKQSPANFPKSLLELSLRAVRQAQPFDPFPAALKETWSESRTVTLVFQYRLNKSS